VREIATSVILLAVGFIFGWAVTYSHTADTCYKHGPAEYKGETVIT